MSHKRFPTLRRIASLAVRNHLFGSAAIVVFAALVISDQVTSRNDFAGSELVKDVESRWGERVVQAAPSLRYVESGAVFTELRPLAFSRQDIRVDAHMNYRKRGLRYFSGFDFTLAAHYTATNPEPHDIDVAFVFPLEADKSQILLSELEFSVGGQPASLDLGRSGDRLTWTGRIAKGAQADMVIRYRGRGLDSFQYLLDPSLRAKNVKLEIAVTGGERYDYPERVLAANEVEEKRDGVVLRWAFPSLESGVALGVTLPSLRSYDEWIATMARRSLVPFLGLFAAVVVFGLRGGRRLFFYEAYLLAAAYGFFFVLLAYLAAFTNFYFAYAICGTGLGAAVLAYLCRLFPREPRRNLALVWLATMIVPTLAVMLEGYTGLIYTLELLGVLLGAMMLSTRAGVRVFIDDALGDPDAAAAPAQEAQ